MAESNLDDVHSLSHSQWNSGIVIDQSWLIGTARMLLPPGGEIRIEDCLHGVDGDITVRAVGPDGKPKRKSRKKKDISIESD